MPEALPGFRTQTSFEAPRSAINYIRSPDLPFDRTLNMYRGCEHGCIYCFARPTHAYLGLSPGLDFETRLIARPGIVEVLERELRKPPTRSRRWRSEPIRTRINRSRRPTRSPATYCNCCGNTVILWPS